MFSSTMNRTRWFSVIVLSVIVLTALTPLRNPSAAGAGTGQPIAEAQPGARQESEPTHSKSASEIPVIGTPQQIVRDRLSKIKSTQELIEQNKSFPMLHQDFSQFKDIVEVVATGYYAGVESTGKKPGHPEYGITYSGVRVKQGILSTIAADPKVFPLGTILYIPGYGYGIVADTGSAIKGKKIDLYYKSKEQIYKEWGKRKVNVFVVHTGNGKVTEQTLQQWDDIMTAIATKRELPYPL
jgi:3D (Asp-Asp-Asp) domain-containing protein